MGIPCIIIFMCISSTVGHKWVESHGVWYYISSDTASYESAVQKCFKLNGYLTDVSGDPRYVAFHDALDDEERYYIGEYYDDTSDFYRWQESGQKVNNTFIPDRNEGYGDCVTFVYDKRTGFPDTWDFLRISCYSWQRYICKSYDQQCDKISVSGFYYQSQLNGVYRRYNYKDLSKDKCDHNNPLYVHNNYDNTLYVCYDYDYHRYTFWENTTYNAYGYTRKPSLHLLDSTENVDEWHNSLKKWNKLYDIAKCVHYTIRIDKPTTVSRSSTTTTTASTTQGQSTKQSTDKTAEPYTTAYSTPRVTGPPTYPQTKATYTGSQDSEAVIGTVLAYMNIAIWGLVVVFVIIDVILFIWWRRLQKRKVN